MMTLAQDVRYAARLLIKQPTFTIAVALTLALGMGANTAMFSVVDAALLRPLPYPKADELAMVWENVNIPAYHNERNTPSPGNFHDWQTDNSVFAEMAAIGYRSWSLTAGEPIRVDGEAVSASLFSVLRIAPELGRTFSPDDDVPGASATVILGHSLWTERYGADERIIGQSIRLNDEPYTVIGVMPASFHFPDPDDQLWVPIALTPEQLANHDSHFLRVVARLKPGVT
ncbi:MAG TPA: ABC transporter permease, partial [Vicinamibacterales bacterium]|nr:ABC transporter permease [Vicinamibacterales bacterium]